MKHFEITKKIIVAVPEAFEATYDGEADFGAIVLRVRNGSKMVNVRVTHLGDMVTVETWDGNKKFYELSLSNDVANGGALNTLVNFHLS